MSPGSRSYGFSRLLPHSTPPLGFSSLPLPTLALVSLLFSLPLDLSPGCKNPKSKNTPHMFAPRHAGFLQGERVRHSGRGAGSRGDNCKRHAGLYMSRCVRARPTPSSCPACPGTFFSRLDHDASAYAFAITRLCTNNKTHGNMKFEPAKVRKLHRQTPV